MKTRLILCIVLCIGVLAMPLLGNAESRIDKIKRTKTLTVGAREGSPPFGFYDKNSLKTSWLTL